MDLNVRAFKWGRIAAQNIDLISKVITSADGEPNVVALQAVKNDVARFAKELVDYQDEKYAQGYLDTTQASRDRETDTLVSAQELAPIIAKNLFKLMAYKDEYEVARLYSSAEYRQALEAQFDGDYSLRFHFAPPLLSRNDPITGTPRKMSFGPWMGGALRILSKFKFLRGRCMDPFGYSDERKIERRLIVEYQLLIDRVFDSVNLSSVSLARELLDLPQSIRGYGHMKSASIRQYRSRLVELTEIFEDANRNSPRKSA